MDFRNFMNLKNEFVKIMIFEKKSWLIWESEFEKSNESTKSLRIQKNHDFKKIHKLKNVHELEKGKEKIKKLKND